MQKDWNLAILYFIIRIVVELIKLYWLSNKHPMEVSYEANKVNLVHRVIDGFIIGLAILYRVFRGWKSCKWTEGGAD